MLEIIQGFTLDSLQVTMLDQQPTLDSIQVTTRGSSQVLMQELQHIQGFTLDSFQEIILGSMQELLPIRVHILETSLETTLDIIHVLEPIQEIMPATLAEHTQVTSLVRRWLQPKKLYRR